MKKLFHHWQDAAASDPAPTIPAEKPTRRIDYILFAPKVRGRSLALKFWTSQSLPITARSCRRSIPCTNRDEKRERELLSQAHGDGDFLPVNRMLRNGRFRVPDDRSCLRSRWRKCCRLRLHRRRRGAAEWPQFRERFSENLPRWSGRRCVSSFSPR